MQDTLYDVDRGVSSKIKEMYFYPYWDEAILERDLMRNQLQTIWRYPKGKEYLRAVYEKWGKAIKRRYVVYRNRLRNKLRKK